MDGTTSKQLSSVEPLNDEQFARRAQAILDDITVVRAERGLQDAILESVDKYVHDEINPELKSFGEVLLLARRQALLQEKLDEDREELHHGHLSHEEKASRGHHYEMLRREACEYNHMLRGLIEKSGEYFTRDELTKWLTTASQGRAKWVHGEVSGSISEIALHAALQGLTELRDMRYGTLEEDLAGFDFCAQWQGQLVTVDAKTGFYPPLSEYKHGHRHLEISVPHESVDDFRVTRRGLDLLRHEVRQALQGGEAVETHGPHQYYRSATA
jgi:hypothetical protein